MRSFAYSMTDKEVAKDVMKANPKTLAQAVELAIADRNLLGALKGPRKATSGAAHTVKEEETFFKGGRGRR